MVNKIKKVATKIKNFSFKYKKISFAIVLILLIVGFFSYKSLTNTNGVTSYILAATSKGTVVSSVSGTGQVSASDQLSLSPGSGASGRIVYLNAVSGRKVSRGTLLLALDTTDAQKNVRDAENNLISAQISLQKLKGPDSLTKPLNKQNAEDTLSQDYQSGYNTVSAIFVDLPAIMTDLQNAVYGNAFGTQPNIYFYTDSASIYDSNSPQFMDSLLKSYQLALDEYNKNFTDYKNTTRSSDDKTIDYIISETYNTTRDISQAIKDTNNLIQFYINTLAVYNIKANPAANTQLATINSDSGKANSDIISLLNAQSSIKSDKVAVTNADLDVTSQQLSLTKAENSLADAKSAVSNYYIYAPFDGIVGAVNVNKGDTISSGTSAITFITQQQFTKISLSEVDITKIKLGNKVVLTFDAINGLSISGKITEIDTIGTVSQGVVNYNVKITFDTQDDRIKPGMSVSANVITDTQQNVLIVPNSAVKSKNGSYYVLVPTATAPTQKIIQIGVADDTNTQIISGLSEGDQIIVRTVTNSSASKTTNAATRSLFGAGGGGGIRPGN